MMEDDDTRGKKEDPIVVQSLADFKYNCELLEGSLGNEDTDFAAEINKLGTWIKWITDRKGTQDHNNHFFKTALPRITRVLLGRAYKHPDTEVPLVVTFLKEMIKVVITHMEADVPEVWGMFRTLLNPKMPFYANHGQDCVPPPPPRYDSDSDSEAAATGTAPWMKAGDTINMNLGGSLIKAKVLELSPTNTEVNLSFVELGATQWLSVDDERLTPLDAEHPTTAAPDAATDAAAAAAEAEEDPEKAAELARQRAEFEAREAVWRNKLAVGRLVDVVDTAKSWYQAVVVDEKEPEADAADADASATESKGEPATAAGEPGEPGDDTADGTAEEKSEAKCTERQVKISFLGWPCAYDEWLPVSSRRMAELNTRSQGRRGDGAVVVALTDQQLEVDDDNDPEDAVAVIRPWKSQHLVNLLASFASCRGFVGLHARLQRMEPPMHISVVRIVICALADIADLFTKPFATRWLGHIIQDFQKQLTNMSAATVRALAPDMVNDFVRCFRLLGRRIMSAEDTGRLVEHLNLDIGRQCFCSDFFERRLNGLSYIQGCIRMVENRASSPNGIQLIPALSTTGSQILRTHVLPVAQYLTAPMLVEWLRTNRVLEDLFQERPHLELMKRSLPVLQFLAKHKALTAADLALVWGASVTSHEPTIESVYQTVGVLAASLEEDLQLVLFGYVRDIETAELNKLSLQLIADLALASGDVGGACRSAANLLWDLMLDSSSLSPVLAALAEKKLLHVVTTTRYNEWRTDFMELCMQGLAASNSSPQMLRLLKGIIHTFSAKTPEGADSSPRADVIANLNAKSNLLQALFEDLQRYNTAARDAAAAGLAADPDFKSAGMFVGGSRTKHADQISGRLSFLGYVLECSPLEVTREQVDLLWNELAVGGVSDADRSLALSWFCQGTDAIMKGDGLLFSSETALHVFNSRMSEESYTNNLSKSGFSCLRAFFLLANHVANRIVANDLHTHYVVADLDLVGLDVIWNVALRCQDNVVATQAERFLTVLLKKLAEPAAMTGDYRRDYVNRCMALLQETHEGEEAGAATARLERCVQLLAAMLTASDVDSAGRFTAHAPELPGSPITVKVLNRIAGHPGKGKPMTLTVYSNQRAFHLIAALADALGYNRTSLKVTVAAKDISKKSMARYPLMSLNVTDGKSVIVSGASRRHKTSKEKQAEKKEAAAAAAKEDGEASGTADGKKKKDKVEMPDVMVLPDEDLAHNIMSHTPEVFNALLGSLDGIAAGDEKAEKITQQVWKLLLRLPTNPQVLHGVRSLASVKAGDAASWRELLDDASSVRLLYSLQIVETMLKNPMDQLSKEKEEEAAASKTDGEEEAKGEGETKGAADPQPDADADAEADEDALQREAAAAEAAAKKAAKQAELEAEAAFRDEWRARFMALGGFQHLLTLLMHDGGVVARAGTEGDLGKTAVALLLRIVRYCFTAAATAAAEHTPEVLKSLRLVAMRSTGGVDDDAPPAAKADTSAEAKGEEDSKEEAKESVPAEVAAAAKAMTAARKVYAAVVTPPDAPSPPTDTQTSPLDPELMTAKLSQEQGQAALAGVDMAGVQQRLLAIVAASLDGEVSVLDARMVSRACGLWQTSLLHQPSLWAARPEECTIDFFTQALLKGDGDGALAVRMHVASAINRICTAIPALPEGEAHPAAFFVRGLLAHMPLDATPAQTKNVGQYFDLTAALLAHVCEGRHGFAASDFEAHLEQLVHAVRDRPMCESRQNTDVDLVLVGLLDVIRVLVSSSQALRKAAGQAQSSGGSDLASYLFNECLFSLPDPRALFNSTSAQPPKCKRSRTRRAAFALLAALARDVPSVVGSLNGSMRGLVEATEATTHFKVNPKLNEKSATGYVGLQNLGCICYMNSLMQQLYMIEPIRYGVLSVLDSQEDKKESLLYQLQNMFGYLELSEQRAYRPAPWCHAFKDMSGRPTNVMVQEDAQEFFNQVCDRVESALKGTAQERLMQSTLRGLFSIQLVCQGDGCDFVSGRPEPFYCVSVEVQGHDNLEDSLKTLVNGELITDYFCDRCQGKRDVRKRSCLDQLNNTMLFHLQRFKFNFDTFQREKINDKFEFPTTIDMYPYSLEGLSWLKEVATQEAAFAAARAAAEADGAEESKGDAPVAPPEVPRPYKLHPKEYYEYELVGCVVHTGTADSGHYYSFIKERGEFFRAHHRGAKDDKPAEWFEFNDALVKPFAVKDLASECFGGKSSSWSSTSKRRNAYMLVYERTSPVAAEDNDATAASAKEPADASTPAAGSTPAGGADEPAPGADQKGDKGATPAGAGDGAGAGATVVVDDEIVTLGAQNHVRVPKSVCDAVFKDNRNHLHATLVNDSELFHFATCLAQDLEATMEPLPPYTVEGDIDPVNNLLNFGLRVLVRSSQNTAFPAFAAALTRLFRANPPACKRFLFNATADTSVVVDPLVRCPSQEARVAFVALLTAVLETLADEEVELLQETIDVEVPVVVEPTPPGGEDAKADEEAPADPEAPTTTTVQQCITFTGRFWDSILDYETLDTVCKSWRQFAEFWTVLLRFAQSGPQQRAFLVSRDTVMRILDLYLGQASPMQATLFKDSKRVRTSMSSRYVKPKWHHAFETVAELVQCSFTDATTVLEKGIPPALLDTTPNTLPPHSRKMILNQKLYTLALGRRVACEPLARIMAHWSWEWPDYSKSVVQIVQRGLAAAAATDVAPYFKVLDEFFAVDDSLSADRVEWVFTGESGLLPLFKSRRTKSPLFTFECIRNLLPLVQKHSSVGAFFSADADTLAWVELFLRRYAKSAKLEKELHDTPGSVPTAPTVPTEEEAMLRIIGAAIGIDMGSAVSSIGVGTSSDDVKVVVEAQKVELAEKALALLGDVVTSFGGALVGEEALVAAEAAAEAAAKEAAAKAADGADGADVMDDDAPSDEDGAPVAPEA